MEQEALNSEKKALFEKIKCDLAKRRKKDNILFLFYLLLAVGLIVSTIKNYDLVVQLVDIILFVGVILLGLHSSYWVGKMSKAATAQELISIYDKNRKIEKWKVNLFTLIAFILSFYFMVINYEGPSFIMLFTAIAVNVFRPNIEKRSDDIDDLRDLEPQVD